MTKELEYEHALGARRLRAEIYITCTSWDGDGLEFEYEWIEDAETGAELAYDDLPKELQSGLDDKAWQLAYDNAETAYQDYIEGEADRLYDQWRDRDQ